MVLCCPPVAQAQLRAERILSSSGTPVAFVVDPVVPGVAYVVHQEGFVEFTTDGSLHPSYFLDLRDVIGSGGERGLLGMAFPPDAATSGHVFCNFTDVNGHTVVARFKRTFTVPYRVMPETRLDFRWSSGDRVIRQPFANHNGGHLAFGPDGYLYIGLGDGGNGNDPMNNAQDPRTLLGKMLRVDVNVADDDQNGFRVPADNPFLDGAPVVALPEIWSFGWRNPWRYSFDDIGEGATGALIVGDVGQNAREEIDYEPSGAGGRNYGWRLREGKINTPGVSQTALAYLPLTEPIHDYPRPEGFAVTGGYVYRGSALPVTYHGRYFFADYVTSRVWSLGLAVDPVTREATPTDLIEHTDELGGRGDLGRITSFGRDLAGELYLTTFSGQVLRIAPSAEVRNPPAPLTPLPPTPPPPSAVVRVRPPITDRQ
jgi:glucose/arabinose dehydrogenase